MQHQQQGSQGQQQGQNWNSPTTANDANKTQTPTGADSMDNNNMKPEVENPQPMRKEEEPIVSDSYNRGNTDYNRHHEDRSATNSSVTENSGSSNKDYRDTNVGFKPDGNNQKENDMQHERSMGSNELDQQWKDQQKAMDR